MESNHKEKYSRRRIVERMIILAGSIILLYLLISLYFVNHFFFNTMINGVNVSLKAHAETDRYMKSFLKDYKLRIIERNGEIEEISGQSIKMKYNAQKGTSQINHKQSPIKWILSLFKQQKYDIKGLYIYDKAAYHKAIMDLNCIKRKQIEPSNVGFQYTDGTYMLIKEDYGNKINHERLNKVIIQSMLKGKGMLDFEARLCYINPKYTLNSEKTLITKDLLNKYVSTKITYQFGDAKEFLDGKVINQWLRVDKNLEIEINKPAIKNYLKELSNKYDTVGRTRSFKTTTGKIIEVKGGLYGWKINQAEEAKALYQNILLGETIEKEPIYLQRALYRDEDEIGRTYVEISITKQHLWFYKDGKLIVHGSVVTGNPNKGNSTVLGTYMLNYKQKDATLKGPGYEAKVTYWMPFYGNMGIHDASWRHSFGGEIYKRNGTHGCVNAPFYLAKKIYENIGEGIPIICYEE